MLVIISDLHQTDGTSGETIPAGAFRTFRERLRDMAYDASWRSNKKYKPIDRIDIVLLGDILDLIRSSKWPASQESAGFVRPWDSPRSPIFQKKIAEISNGILRRNKDALDVLKGLSEGKQVTLPPATRDGKPAPVSHEASAAGRVPVDVRIHYQVGNHDWFYHLPGTAYNRIRSRVVKAMGLANSPNEPFPHDPDESEELTKAYRDHHVLARHGDVFDSFNYEGDRDQSSLGDAIVIDLLNKFPTTVTKKMGQQLPPACLDGLNEIDNVRPLILIPAWVDGLLRRTCSSQDQIKGVKRIWDELADQFLAMEFVRERDVPFSLDIVDKLAFALKFSQGFSLRSASKLLTWFNERFGAGEESYYKEAFGERDFKNRRAHHIVYGHTHRQRVVALDTSFSEAGVLERLYMNSGTWRRVHEMARLNPKDEEFVNFNVMTYIGFYKGDERAGRPFELWSGALGVEPAAHAMRS